LDAIAAIRRVLTPDGTFYFSTHNLESTRALADARHGPRMRRVKDPYRQLRAVAGFVRGRVNHRRFAKYQRFGTDYAIINDEAHGWRLLHYYISRAGQVTQLEQAGFRVVDVFAVDGSVLAPGADDSGFTELHYVALVH
jgi:hypothetical protein